MYRKCAEVQAQNKSIVIYTIYAIKAGVFFILGDSRNAISLANFVVENVKRLPTQEIGFWFSYGLQVLLDVFVTFVVFFIFPFALSLY